jgi:hypothetical protein
MSQHNGRLVPGLLLCALAWAVYMIAQAVATIPPSLY